MTQAHLFITGKVQGVGFRQYAKYRARKTGLTGWTRNLSDGRVEVILQGEKDVIDGVILYLQKGPFLAEVTEVTVAWEEGSEEFETFLVRPTEII